MTWMPSFSLVSSMAHLFAGAAVVLALCCYRRPRLGMVLVAAWALPKEFWFDIAVEGDSWGGSARDAIEYLAGGLAAVGWYRIALAWERRRGK